MKDSSIAGTIPENLDDIIITPGCTTIVYTDNEDNQQHKLLVFPKRIIINAIDGRQYTIDDLVKLINAVA